MAATAAVAVVATTTAGAPGTTGLSSSCLVHAALRGQRTQGRSSSSSISSSTCSRSSSSSSRHQLSRARRLHSTFLGREVGPSFMSSSSSDEARGRRHLRPTAAAATAAAAATGGSGVSSAPARVASWIRPSPSNPLRSRQQQLLIQPHPRNTVQPLAAYIGKLGGDTAAARSAAESTASNIVAAAGSSKGGGSSASTTSSVGAGTGAAGAKSKPLTDARALFFSLAIAIVLPVVLGVGVSVWASPLSQWYRDLDKPAWEPPDWAFGVAWSLLYLGMGVASWLVWMRGGWAAQAGPLKLYLAQLGVNLLWPIVFFRWKRIRAALGVLGVLFVLVIRTLIAFAAVSPLAGWLLAPYALWLLFASALNYEIWRRNRDNGNDGSSGGDWSPPAEVPQDGGAGGGNGGGDAPSGGVTWNATVRIDGAKTSDGTEGLGSQW